ncbi:D-alanine--D-alanine ligase [Candidatus Uhrbacteria bacterium]|nr:D-alanine--D-alanine ligase [Candidatus Uhrbacteria bacterium]
MKRLGVLLGGISNEREISLKSGKQIIKHLDRKKYQIRAYDPKTQLMRFIKDAKSGRIDIVFNALHGKGGEDGSIQGVLDWLNIPYTGSGVLASALTMDKEKTKAMYRQNGIPTPPSIIVESVDLKRIKSKLGKQIVIKPNMDGSSVGVSVNPPYSQWKKLIESRIKAEGSCLLESFRAGRELTVGILGSQALPVIEIRPKTAFFDFEAKYIAGMCEEICPAPIPKKITLEAQALALKAHKILGCRGYSRTDMIWGKKGIEVLETNTLPGMTETSLLPLAARTAGITYPKLLDHMIRLAGNNSL